MWWRGGHQRGGLAQPIVAVVLVHVLVVVQVLVVVVGLAGRADKGGGWKRTGLHPTMGQQAVVEVLMEEVLSCRGRPSWLALTESLLLLQRWNLIIITEQISLP